MQTRRKHTILPITIHLFIFAQKISFEFSTKQQIPFLLLTLTNLNILNGFWLILDFYRRELYWILEDEQVTDDLVDVEPTFYMKFRSIVLYWCEWIKTAGAP